MPILVDHTSVVLVQGITGKEGLKAATSMRDYGTKVVAGVTPGKGGQTVEGFPVFNTVAEAMAAFPTITTSVLYVPAAAVFDAALEAFDAGIDLVNVITEQVPVYDTARLIAYARRHDRRLIGPSSIGCISPGVAKLGSIGGFDPTRSFSTGPIGVISKSGGMCSEIAHMLTESGLGQSTVIGVGGDRLCGTTFADLLPLYQSDPQTKAVVIYGEIGGTYEEEVAVALQQKRFTKPLVACISGIFAETLPSGLHLGHAGAIIEGNVGTRTAKVAALTEAGAHVVNSSDDIPQACASLLHT